MACRLTSTVKAAPSPSGSSNDPAQNKSIQPIQKLPYGRCPSDGWESDKPWWTNYAASQGPQQMEQF